jgi:hypothetical protein
MPPADGARMGTLYETWPENTSSSAGLARPETDPGPSGSLIVVGESAPVGAT